MSNKIKKWWSELAEDVNQHNSKYSIVNFLTKRLSWMMVNTLYFLTVSLVVGLISFTIAMLIGESNDTILFKTSGEGFWGYIFDKDVDMWEVFFFGGILGFMPWVVYGIVAIVYVWIIRPIKGLIKKTK